MESMYCKACENYEKCLKAKTSSCTEFKLTARIKPQRKHRV